jgi:hypothetical protein
MGDDAGPKAKGCVDVVGKIRIPAMTPNPIHRQTVIQISERGRRMGVTDREGMIPIGSATRVKKII